MLDKLWKERSSWSIKDDAEYFYMRGKLDALAAIVQFIKRGGGSSRVLAYGYLDLTYVTALDYGCCELSNFVHDALNRIGPQRPYPEPKQ